MLNWRKMHWAKLKGGFKGNTAFFRQLDISSSTLIFLLHTSLYLSGEELSPIWWEMYSNLLLSSKCFLFSRLLNPELSTLSSSVIFFCDLMMITFSSQNSGWDQIERQLNNVELKIKRKNWAGSPKRWYGRKTSRLKVPFTASLSLDQRFTYFQFWGLDAQNVELCWIMLLGEIFF